MNKNDPRYAKYNLVSDMLATADVVQSFDPSVAATVAQSAKKTGRLLLTGEGSSRIFPAKHAIFNSRQRGDALVLHTEAGVQSTEFNLEKWTVLAASNSGRTAEVVGLFDKLRSSGHQELYSLAAFADSKLESVAKKGFVLQCGPEGAVAATKSVVEQALFVQSVVEQASGVSHAASDYVSLAQAIRDALTMAIDSALVTKLANAGTIYFAGRNDGVGEELTLKTNEITRKKSDFLEGTYAVHGIEEVMNRDDVLVWVDPYPGSESKFEDVLVKGVGLTVIAIADRPTRFPTIQVPSHALRAYVMLAAGWNLLVEVGVALGIDVDKPVRARKVGNEFVAG
jgi:glucosamine--fructose-6-phosphate aminotransferase (isomerizing)